MCEYSSFIPVVELVVAVQAPSTAMICPWSTQAHRSPAVCRVIKLIRFVFSPFVSFPFFFFFSCVSLPLPSARIRFRCQCRPGFCQVLELECSGMEWNGNRMAWRTLFSFLFLLLLLLLLPFLLLPPAPPPPHVPFTPLVSSFHKLDGTGM